jgi:hypothetical protein
MTIPYKLFSRLIQDLEEFLAKPCNMTDGHLLETEEQANWPWNADAAQQAEWQATQDRLRPTFEAAVAVLRSAA